MPEYKPYNARERFEQTSTESGRRRLGVIEYSPAKRSSKRPRNTQSPFAVRSEKGAPGFFSSLWENFRFLIEDAVNNWRLRRETAKTKAKEEEDIIEESPEAEGEDAAEPAPQSQRQPAPQAKSNPGERRANSSDQRQRNAQQTSQGQRARDRQPGGNQPRAQQQAPRQTGQRNNQPQGPRKPDLRDQLRQQQAAQPPAAQKQQPTANRSQQRPAQPPAQAQQSVTPPTAPRPSSPNASQTRRDLSRLHQSRRPRDPQLPPPKPEVS